MNLSRNFYACLGGSCPTKQTSYIAQCIFVGRGAWGVGGEWSRRDRPGSGAGGGPHAGPHKVTFLLYL